MLWKIVKACGPAALVGVSMGIANAQSDPKMVCAENIAVAEEMVEETAGYKERVDSFAMDISTKGFGAQQISAVGEVRNLRHSLLAALEEYRQKAEDLAYAMRTCAR